MRAARNDNADSVRLLLEAGLSNVNSKDNVSKRMFMCTCMCVIVIMGRGMCMSV